jgi:hypothetical protein
MSDWYDRRERAAVVQLQQALPELEAQWKRLQAPIATALQPGMDPLLIDRLGASEGLRVPTELKVLWSWHNGATRPSVPGVDHSIGPGGYDFLSVEEALEVYRQNREWHAESVDPEDSPETYWHESWLPFMTQQAERLYVDCERVVTAAPGRSPIRLVSHEWEAFDVDLAASLLDAVWTWTWLLQQNYYTFDEHGQGHVDFAAVPVFLRRLA